MKAQKKKNYDKQIKAIMKEFDFERVRKTMCALNWTWGANPSRVPTVQELMRSAESLLEDTVEAEYYGGGVASGGFQAKLDFNGVLSLEFVVVEWDGSKETNGKL